MAYTINSHYSAKSFNERIRYLVFHYTALDFHSSLNRLTQGEVSAHYLIPAEAVNGEPQIYRLVEESKRAWHAGVSAWQNRENLNDTSIGIEIVNLGFKDEPGKPREWYPFTEYQIQALTELSKGIIARYGIEANCVIGHSDIAPGRKVDPGLLFPWKRLAENGVGAWYDEGLVLEQLKDKAFKGKSDQDIDIVRLQKNLKQYGYKLESTGVLDEQTTHVLKAFQLHFVPEHCSGKPNLKTCLILESLIDKYDSLNA